MKVFVEVIAKFDIAGNIRPLSIKWKDGVIYEISKIKDIRPASSLKAGGVGIRYTCVINNKETYIFLEDTKWFVESK